MSIEEEGIFQLYNLVSEHPTFLKEANGALRNGSAKCTGSKFKPFVNQTKRTCHVSIYFRFTYLQSYTWLFLFLYLPLLISIRAKEISSFFIISQDSYICTFAYIQTCDTFAFFFFFYCRPVSISTKIKWTYHWSSSSSAIVVLSTFKDLCKKKHAIVRRVRTYMNFMVIEYLPLDQKWRKCRIIFGSLKPCLLLVAYVRADFFYFMLCTSIASLTFRCIDHYGVES